MKRNTILREILVLSLLVIIGHAALAQSKKQQIATLQATVDSLNHEKAALQDKVQELNTNVKQLTNEKNYLQKENNNLQKKVSDTNRVCKSLRGNIANLTREKKEVEQKLSEAERKREEAVRNGTFQMGPDMMKKLSTDNYMSMYEVQVSDCSGWGIDMDGRYRFYNFENCEYGVMVALDNRGNEKENEKYICSYTCCVMSSGDNLFSFVSGGSLVMFRAGYPEAEVYPSLYVNDEECNFRVTKRYE